jgi:hypothetical protein
MWYINTKFVTGTPISVVKVNFAFRIKSRSRDTHAPFTNKSYYVHPRRMQNQSSIIASFKFLVQNKSDPDQFRLLEQ